MIKIRSYTDDTGVKSLEIKFSHKLKIQTPTRAINSSEIAKIKAVRNLSTEPISPFEAAEEEFPWKIYEIPKEFSSDVIKKLRETGKGLENKRSQINREINQLVGVSQADELFKILYIKRESKHQVFNESDLLMMAEIQHRAKVDAIVVPESKVGMNPEAFEKELKMVDKFLERLGNEKIVIPLIYPDKELAKPIEFQQKLNTLLDLGYRVIGIQTHTFSLNPNLYLLREFSKKNPEIWIHNFGTWKHARGGYAYLPHIATVFGIDSVGILSRPFIPSNPSEDSDSKKEKQQISSKLLVYNPEDWGIYPEKVIQKMPTSRWPYFKKSLMEVKEDSDKAKVYAVHEAYSAQLEMADSAKAIKKGEFRELLFEKGQVKKELVNKFGLLIYTR